MNNIVLEKILSTSAANGKSLLCISKDVFSAANYIDTILQKKHALNFSLLGGASADATFLSNKESNILVADIEQLISKINQTPISLGQNYFIIYNLSTVSAIVQNKLLKTLEELPQTSTVVFVASCKSGVLATIESRCMQINLASEQAGNHWPLSTQVISTAFSNQNFSCSSIIKLEEAAAKEGLQAVSLLVAQAAKEAKLPESKKFDIIAIADSMQQKKLVHCSTENIINHAAISINKIFKS